MVSSQTQSEELRGDCGPAGGRAPVQVLCGRTVDVGSYRGEKERERTLQRESSFLNYIKISTELLIYHISCCLSVSQAVMTSKTGTVNNVIQVKTTDFEVFDALRIDSEDSADLSGTHTCIHSLLTAF